MPIKIQSDLPVKEILEKEKFEQDNNIDVAAVTDVLSNLH